MKNSGFRFGKALAFLCISISPFANAQQKQLDPPLMGWSSWNTYRINIDESLIKKQADAMVNQGLKDAGYLFINVDDGFFGYRDEEGNLQTHPQRFPNGMKVIADYIHSKGLKAGIYSDAGSNTCGSLWDNDPNGKAVGLYGHERRDANLFFNQWGYDFIKIDYCGAGQQLDLDEQKRYTEIVEAIRETANRPVSINICRWAYPGAWVKNLSRSWRISPDISANWGSVKFIIGKNLYLSAFAGDGHYNDMDMLEIGRGLSQNEEEVHFGMWCIMSSPLLIGCDLTTIPEASLALLKNPELIALNQDPLGLQAHVVQHEGNGYVLVKDIEKKRGLKRAVAFYNPSDSACTITIPLSALELGGKTKVRDLIKRENEPSVSNELSYTIPARSVKMVSLEGKTRLEPSRYEAETAFLPQYNDLGKRSRGIDFKQVDEASGKMLVANIGGEAENTIDWNEVYSQKGGKYTIKIACMITTGERSLTDHKLLLTVNGVSQFVPLNTEVVNKLQTVEAVIDLKPGYNTIQMGSPYTWAPNIDCFELIKQN